MSGNEYKETYDFYKLNAFDVVLIALVICVSLGVFLFTNLGLDWSLSKSVEAYVFQEGKVLKRLKLDKDQKIVIAGGKMVLETKEGRIRVLESDCPRKICVLRGWIENPGEVIVCVPNRIFIEIKSAKGDFLDAVVG